jgi:hypothetical protein
MSILVSETLKITEIQHTNGTTAFTINPSGYISNSKKVAFNARANGTTQSFANGAEVTYFTNIELNNGNHYNTSNGRFTAPIAGYYFFFVNVLSANNNLLIDFRIAKNGTYLQGGYSSDYNGHSQANGGAIVQLNPGDYVSVFSVNVNGQWWGSAVHSYWMGFLI